MNINKAIYEFNLSYLHLVQKLLAEDRTSNLFRLGINIEIADILDGLTENQIRLLAQTNHLICYLRIKEPEALKSLIQESRVDQLQQIHAGIIVSGNEH